MTMTRLMGLAALIVAALAATVVSGQDHQSDRAPSFSSRTQLVTLQVNVQDRKGGFVPHLTADAFAVFEDGKPQRVTFFEREDSAVTIGLIVDNSISMQARRELVLAAASAFSHSVHVDDLLFALVFNERVRPVLDAAAPFTSDAAHLDSALRRAVTSRGRTAFFDAAVEGLAYAERSTQQRRVLVIIGDGGDNASSSTFADVLRRAQASDVVIYAVALVDPLDRDANPKRLEELAAATGGRSFSPANQRTVGEVLQRISAEIRHTYTLAYEPERVPDGSFRRVVVRVTAPGERRVEARTRHGYLATTVGALTEGSHGGIR
jgi:Ca-activated chloride channel homolog